MKLYEYIVKNPVVPIVINTIIVIVGIVFFLSLSVREYPRIIIPEFTIETFYPNASPDVVEAKVTYVIEESLAALEDLENFTSQTSKQNSKVFVRFKAGTNLEDSFIRVREKVSKVQGELPKAVKGPHIKKESKDEQVPLMHIGISSTKLSPDELTHYVKVNLENHFRAIENIARVEIVGPRHIMWVRLHPEKLLKHQIQVGDISKVLSKVHAAYPAGENLYKIPLSIDETRTTPESFHNIVVAQRGDALIRLKDLADVSLKPDPNTITRFNGKEGVDVKIYPSGFGNPITISSEVRRVVATLEKQSPSWLSFNIFWDESAYIKDSYHTILSSLAEAIILVSLIIFLFLGKLRFTLIPLVSIPISLIGVGGFLYYMGFTVNTITLLALILAIGMVVDDSIVVMENIYRYIEKGLSPLKATLKGGQEMITPVIAMTLTLAVVYIPIAFIQGEIRFLFMEFALTLACAILISGVVSLTLAPVLCTRILKKEKGKSRKFDTYMAKTSVFYESLLQKTLKFPLLNGSLYLLVFAGIFIFYNTLPQELAPAEDRQFVGAYVDRLHRADMATFDQYTRKVEHELRSLPESVNSITIGDQYGANILASLVPKNERERSSHEITKDLKGTMRLVPSVASYPFTPISGVPGFDQRQGNPLTVTLAFATTKSYETLSTTLDEVAHKFRRLPFVESVSTNINLDSPIYNLQLNHPRVFALGIDAQDISNTLQVYTHYQIPGVFVKDGFEYNIHLASQQPFENLESIYVSHERGNIAISNLASLKTKVVPATLHHRERKRSGKLDITLKESAGIGKSRAQDMFLEKLKPYLDNDLTVDFGDFHKKVSEVNLSLLFVLFMSIVFIYGILSIQFNSFSDSFIILLTVPLSSFGALLLLFFTGSSLNIFSQIGLITLIGIITKNGILIVEFTNRYLEEGYERFDAVIRASSHRLRPILMTALSTLLSAVPLILSTNSGSEARHAIGITIIGGIGIGTFLTLFLIPYVSYLFKGWQYRAVEQR